jgi:hypothetical protein
MKTSSAKLEQTPPVPVVRILFSDSGRGLHADADLLQELLERQGWRVIRQLLPVWTVAKTQRSLRYASIRSFFPGLLTDAINATQVRLGRFAKEKADLQIHLESLSVDYLSAATTNWLIPNQEWVKPQHLCFFSYLDAILCKSQTAMEVFRPYHENTRFIGFSNPAVAKKPHVDYAHDRFRRFLHVAGRNRKKGSLAIVEAWRRHPEWPELQLVIDDVSDLGRLPANIRLWRDVDDRQLTELRRQNGIVLAPSEVEGFGHILLEGMLHGGIVLTTDAPPMNELIARDRGMLLDWSVSEPFHLGMRYFVTPSAVEQAVGDVLLTSTELLSRKARIARDWVVDNDRRFGQLFSRQLAQVAMRSNDQVEAS